MAKAAINLTLNSIIVIIFGITILGLGLAFITGQFNRVAGSISFPTPDIPATADQPIILPFDTLSVNRGTQVDFFFNFYNNENASVAAEIIPVITECQPAQIGPVSMSAVGQVVDVGTQTSYKALLTVPKGAPSQKYACNLQISHTSKQFIMEVT